MSVEEVVKPHIRDLAPYSPGKPMEELERELGIRNSIKLASNENPLGPSPRAIEAVKAAAADVHRYPDGACFALRAKLAKRLGVEENQLVFGTGADEILELIAKTLIGPGDEVITTPFTWFSTASCISRLGAIPVFVDINPRTYCLESRDIEGQITPKTT